MNIFRQLRWKLTLSYTLVTIGAFLVIVLVLAGLAFTQIFIPDNSINPEQFVVGWLNSTMDSNYQMWSQILSQSPVDIDLVSLYLKEGHSNISGSELFRLGAVQFSASTRASVRVFILGPDGILLGTSDMDNPIYRSSIGIEIGKPFDPTLAPGLEGPLKAALAGDTDPKHLYTVLEPNKRYIFAGPIFNSAGGAGNDLAGVMVVLFETLPTQKDIPAHILNLAGRSLIVFLIGVGLIGAIFGAIFADGLTKRFTRISTTTDLWSVGDFSRYIDDTTGDEMTQFTQRLNNMAKQLQSLLRRRQEMAVSEERNRLARDLHDSAKQQALAASLELGTALTLYERDPENAKKHLVEADVLVDAVRKELTNLVHELRPQDMDGQDFSETLKDYAIEWSLRNGIELNFHVEGSNEIPLETRETLFRIAQEALANVARHSSASYTDMSLDFRTNNAVSEHLADKENLVGQEHLVTMAIKDDGCGFDTSAFHGGVGLASMRERAEGLGGSFTVESAPGQGTEIVVSLPLAGIN
jgi:two-component system, NarL family, sensor histidine kinase LiaS